MENAAEALKIAFAVMLFVMALTLSMSSFSQATRAVNAITSARDRDIEWAGDLNNDGNYYNDGYYKYNMYVTPSENLTRIVGIETVITSIYTAFEENIEIHFFESDGETPINLYYETINGVKTGEIITTIDSANTNFKDEPDMIDFLDIIMGGTNALNNKEETVQDKYREILYYTDGLYDAFKNFKFEEKLGEYKQGTDSNAMTKRVITYIKK